MGPQQHTDAKLQRLAVSNWGYSWLTRTQRPCDEYASLEQVFAELQSRGYNAIRLDPFPHLLARDAQGIHMPTHEILPHSPLPGLDQPGVIKVDVRTRLLQLLELAHRHEVRIILTSWFCPDRRAARSFVRSPSDYVRVWTEALQFIEQSGFGRTVHAIDFANEFPAGSWHPGAFRHIFNSLPANPLPMMRQWKQEEEARVQTYLVEVPRALRALFPQYAFGMSCSPVTQKHIRLLDTSELDFIDFHIWLGQNNMAERLNQAFNAPANLPGLLLRRRGSGWRKQVDEQITGLDRFTSQRRLDWMVTEGFVLPGSGKEDWARVREVSDFVVRKLLEHSVSVTSTGSFAAPHQARFWSAIRWHQLLTTEIREGQLLRQIG